MRCIGLIALLSIIPGCAGDLTPVGSGGGGGGGGGGADAGDGQMLYRPQIQSDLDSSGCALGSACHGGDIAPMPLVANPASEDDWIANYNQVSARVGTSGSSLLIDKSTGAGGHTVALAATDAILVRWRAWIDNGAPYEQAPPAADAGTTTTVDAGVSDTDASDALTWEANISPLLVAAGCISCHGAQGSYSLESYSAALGFGTDGTANVIPGDATSLLIVYAEQGHFGIANADALQVISWIVDWDAQER